MAHPVLETDYLILGSGAAGMAFADTLLHETDASMVIVDKHHSPGGHWNDAYPFVRLHQPSAYYGVNSRPLGGDGRDAHPLNLGMCERASSAEILAYYDAVMQSMLASGRVRYFPMSELAESNAWPHFQFTALTSGAQTHVQVRKKFVNSAYMSPPVPATHARQYAVADGLRCVPPNDLPKVTQAPSGYLVVGGGKTGIDVCLWLLENQVDPAQICWIVPRDAWMINRGTVQAAPEFFEASFGGMAAQMEAVLAADSVDDLILRLESADQLLRLDPAIKPRMYHAATVSKAELMALRRIKNIVRLGRVQRIDATQVVLEHGSIPMDARRLVVDCSASIVHNRDAVPIFSAHTITPQFVRAHQPCMSAAVIAYLEAHCTSDEEKNAMSLPVPMLHDPRCWLTMQLASMANRAAWAKDKALMRWMNASRLNGFGVLAANVLPTELDKIAILQRFGKAAAPAAAKLQQLLAA